MCTLGHHVPKIHSSTPQCPSRVKCINTLQHIHPMGNYMRRGQTKHKSMQQEDEFHGQKTTYLWVYFYKVRTLAKDRGVDPLGGVVAARGPRGFLRVVLIWVQATRTYSICANSPKHTLRICVRFCRCFIQFNQVSFGKMTFLGISGC